MTIIYHYHATSGEYLGTGEADKSPLEPDVFLVPAHATESAPPETEQGMARVFVDNAWIQVADHRGETWWDENGIAVIVDFIGDPVEHDLSDIEPPAPEPIDPVPPRPRIIAGGYGVTVSDGDITSIETSGGISAGIYLSPGMYLMFFQVEQTDDNYFIRSWDDSGNRFALTFKDVASFIIEVTDMVGNPADPPTFNTEVVRVS